MQSLADGVDRAVEEAGLCTHRYEHVRHDLVLYEPVR
jgi:hypothetical protein